MEKEDFVYIRDSRVNREHEKLWELLSHHPHLIQKFSLSIFLLSQIEKYVAHRTRFSLLFEVSFTLFFLTGRRKRAFSPLSSKKKVCVYCKKIITLVKKNKKLKNCIIFLPCLLACLQIYSYFNFLTACVWFLVNLTAWYKLNIKVRLLCKVDKDVWIFWYFYQRSLNLVYW